MCGACEVFRNSDEDELPIKISGGDREMLDELTDALHNMLGIFDTPVARMKMQGDFEDEARKIAREVFERAKSEGYGMK